MTRLKSALVASAALLTLGVAAPAHAEYLPNVKNLNFVDYSGTAPKGYFTDVKPVGWVGGGGLIFVDAPGTADDGTYLSVYKPFPTNSPVGGNFVEADGNPDFEGSFSQTISGLTPGKTYTLSFYQAGGQQEGFANGQATTERWIVSLGLEPLTVNIGAGPIDPEYGPTATYSNADPNASVVASALMTTPSGGVTPWQYVSVDVTANAETQLLSFLAWGNNGSTINLPPIVFLAGVNSPDVLTPEPMTLSVIGAGIAGLVGVRLRRRARG